MNEKLIDQLTSELKPCHPCCPYAMTARLTMMGLFGGAVLLFVLGLRPDMQVALTSIFPWWKSGIFALFGLGAAFSLMRLGFPGRGIGTAGPAMMIFGAAGIVSFVVASFTYSQNMMSALYGLTLAGKGLCLSSVLGLGFLLMLGGTFVVRRMAFTEERLAGAMLGFASGAFAAAAYAWHCINDQPMFVAAWYALPVATLGLLGFTLGRRLFRL